MTLISVALACVREGSEPVAAPPLRALGLPKVHPCLERPGQASSLQFEMVCAFLADGRFLRLQRRFRVQPQHCI